MKRFFKRALVCGGAIMWILLFSGVTFAASSTQTLTVNATVSARAELTLSPTTINFADASPTTTPSIAADSTVSVTAKVRTGSASAATLKVLANGDLTSGADKIAISAISWTASGAPFIAGTMNKTTAQDGATFALGSGSFSGTYTFSLAIAGRTTPAITRSR